jgi:predicted ATPase
MESSRRVTSPFRATAALLIHRIVSFPEKMVRTMYPFNIPVVSHAIDLTFRSKVTFNT